MTEVPEVIPVRMALVAPIVATLVVPLAHVPPVIALLKVVILPMQSVVVPVIGALGLTTTVFVAVDTSPHASVAVTV